MADQHTAKPDAGKTEGSGLTQKTLNDAVIKVCQALETFQPPEQSRILRAASVMLGIEQRPAQQQRPPQQQQRGNGR